MMKCVYGIIFASAVFGLALFLYHARICREVMARYKMGAR